MDNSKKTKGNNESIKMTRRFPKLLNKVLIKDSEIVKKIVFAWDIEKNSNKVLSIYLKEHKNLSNERYWEILRTVWIICGTVENSELFKNFMKSNRKEKYYFSTPEELKFLRELPNDIVVYRATNIKDVGLSWTLSKDYADWYAKEFNKETVICKIIDKKQIFAYIERNKESEILIL